MIWWRPFNIEAIQTIVLLWSTALPLDSSRPYWLVTKDSSNPWLSVVAFYLYSWTTYSPTVGTLNCHLFITAQQASSTCWSPPIPSLHTQTRTCNCRRCSWCRIRVPTPQVMQSRDHYITIAKQKCIFIIAMVDVPLPASHVSFSGGGREYLGPTCFSFCFFNCLTQSGDIPGAGSRWERQPSGGFYYETTRILWWKTCRNDPQFTVYV